MNACRRFQVTLTLSAAVLAATPLDIRADVIRLEISVATTGRRRPSRRNDWRVQDPSREDPRRNRSRRSAQQRHPGSRPGTPQRARQGGLRRHVCARQTRGHDESRARAAVSGREPRERSGHHRPRRVHLAHQRMAGRVVPTQNNQTIVVPVARGRDGGVLTGPVLARFIDVPDGASTAPIRLASLGTPQPYLPANLSEPGAVMTMYSSETRSGAQQGRQTIARSDWAFANCEKVPFPGTPDPTRVCLRDGFRSNRAYQLVYTAKDPLVLGVGLAATRDIVSFFRYADRDRDGTANPVAGAIDRAVSVGDSQSGNFIRTFIHLGFNQDESNRIVWDGAFPRIAARQTPMNLRFALPGGAAGLYEPGSDGIVWWGRYEDTDPRTEAGQPAGSLHRGEDLPEDHRGVRICGVLGPAHVPGSHRYRCEGRHSAARQRAPLLLSGHHARRRPRRISCRAGRSDVVRRRAMRAAGESESRSRYDARAHAGAGRVGHSWHTAAAEPLPDAGERRSRAGDDSRDGTPGHSRPQAERPDRQPAARLRLRPVLQVCRCLRSHDDGATARAPGLADLRAAREPGR